MFRSLVIILSLFFLLQIAVNAPALEKDATIDSLKKSENYSKKERSHWSFQAVVQPKVPEFNDADDQKWIRQPIDAFILRKLKEAKLRPASAADRQTLIRRLYFDLLGLPPTPLEVLQFVDDRSPRAYEKLVDRLLKNPHYGERWGQHWLDVVRFAETEGFEYDRHRPNAWRYRDYVVSSFNNDKPYDIFLTEQVAGDELVESRNKDQGIAAQTAVGFHRLGPVRRNAGNAEVSFSRNEVLTEMTNIIGAAYLGLTVGCSRCHDHFYDPLRQKDYYRLQGFLAATHEYDIQLSSEKDQQTWQAKTDKVKAELEKIKVILKDALTDAQTELELRKQLVEVETRLPAPLPAIFSVRNIDDERTPIHLLSRGDEEQKRERLGMRVPGVLLPEGTPELPADTSQPKSILARWLTNSENPLTARVMVNRIWLYHFGQGIVATANDFGFNGSGPSHPELLDFLASEFVKNGWSIKKMHRMILLSNTYRQSSRSALAAPATAIDPENRLLWRFSRRRLDAEEIRDAMLMIAGRLNTKAGGPSIIIPVEQELIDLLYKPSQWEVTKDKREHDRRSIYLLAKRNLKLPFLEVFDQPDLQTSCDRRERSTHAPQALELLNGRLSNELADAFTVRLKREAGPNVSQQVELAFQMSTGRSPSEKEKQLALEFLKTEPLREFALVMFNLNTFLYVD